MNSLAPEGIHKIFRADMRKAALIEDQSIENIGSPFGECDPNIFTGDIRDMNVPALFSGILLADNNYL